MSLIKIGLTIIAVTLMTATAVVAKDDGPHLSLKLNQKDNLIHLKVYLNPEGTKISGVETTIKFPTQNLKFKNYQTTGLLPVEVISPHETENGISFSLAISPQQPEVTKEGELLELEFLKVGSGQYQLETENTIITSLESKINLASQEARVQSSNGSFWSKLMTLLKKILAIFKTKEVSK